jgi:hypothetical protein
MPSQLSSSLQIEASTIHSMSGSPHAVFYLPVPKFLCQDVKTTSTASSQSKEYLQLSMQQKHTIFAAQTKTQRALGSQGHTAPP